VLVGGEMRETRATRRLMLLLLLVVTAGARLKLALLQRINNLLAVADRGVARGVLGVLGPPSPIPLKILGIKRVRTTHALHIRLIEL